MFSVVNRYQLVGTALALTSRPVKWAGNWVDSSVSLLFHTKKYDVLKNLTNEHFRDTSFNEMYFFIKVNLCTLCSNITAEKTNVTFTDVTKVKIRIIVMFRNKWCRALYTSYNSQLLLTNLLTDLSLQQKEL